MTAVPHLITYNKTSVVGGGVRLMMTVCPIHTEERIAGGGVRLITVRPYGLSMYSMNERRGWAGVPELD